LGLVHRTAGFLGFKGFWPDFRNHKDLKYFVGFRPDFKDFRSGVRDFSDLKSGVMDF